MANILFDYAVPFNQVESLPAPSFGFLHRLAVAVLHDEAGAPPDVTLVTDPADLPALTTYAPDLLGAFDGGLNSIILARVQTIAELATLAAGKEGQVFTLFAHNSLDAVEFDTGVTWKGVKAAVIDMPLAPPLASNMCIFGTNGAMSSYSPLFAFGKLLSAASWRNQQYITTPGSVGMVEDLGMAELAFEERVSFWLHDDDAGNRLGFFAHKGKSITTPYIGKEVELTMQYQMTNFMTVNQPFNVAVERAELERIGNKVIQENITRGYLDPDKTNAVKITESVEQFVVAGNLTTSPAVALWRVKMDAYQTQG